MVTALMYINMFWFLWSWTSSLWKDGGVFSTLSNIDQEFTSANSCSHSFSWSLTSTCTRGLISPGFTPATAALLHAEDWSRQKLRIYIHVKRKIYILGITKRLVIDLVMTIIILLKQSMGGKSPASNTSQTRLTHFQYVQCINLDT